MASVVMIVFLAPDLVQDRTVGLRTGRSISCIKAIRPMGWSVRFDVRLRSGMEISDLMPQFMQNHDRIFTRNDRKGRSDVEIRAIFYGSLEILDQAVGDLTRHNRASHIWG
jgi:hypothetical protein